MLIYQKTYPIKNFNFILGIHHSFWNNSSLINGDVELTFDAFVHTFDFQTYAKINKIEHPSLTLSPIAYDSQHIILFRFRFIDSFPYLPNITHLDATFWVKRHTCFVLGVIALFIHLWSPPSTSTSCSSRPKNRTGYNPMIWALSLIKLWPSFWVEIISASSHFQ